jgi:hypothetical protein
MSDWLVPFHVGVKGYLPPEGVHDWSFVTASAVRAPASRPSEMDAAKTMREAFMTRPWCSARAESQLLDLKRNCALLGALATDLRVNAPVTFVITFI